MSQYLLKEFNDLYNAYDQGLYTDTEIVSKSLELLGEGDADLWAAFPDNIRDEIRKQLESFSEKDELVSFSSEDVDSLKKRLLSVKRWLTEHE
jgi:hypothetical protein